MGTKAEDALYEAVNGIVRTGVSSASLPYWNQYEAAVKALRSEVVGDLFALHGEVLDETGDCETCNVFAQYAREQAARGERH